MSTRARAGADLVGVRVEAVHLHKKKGRLPRTGVLARISLATW